MDYVTDTHSLVWYFTEDSLLSKKALEAFEETLSKIEECKNFDIAALDANILKVADKIKVDMEMHDKLIVATTLYFNATLITKYRLIRDTGICLIIW